MSFHFNKNSGLILTGVFAQQSIIALSYPVGATNVPIGGMLDGNYHQVLVQLAAITSVTAWSFVVTYGILYVMNCFPGLRLRLEDHEEELGTDIAQMGETAYGFLPLLGRNGVDEESTGSLRKSGNLNTGSSCSSSHCVHHHSNNNNNSAGGVSPASSGGSTVGGNGVVGALGNASSTTLNLDLHEIRPDEDDDHPRRLPEMTEQNARRSARLAHAHRHSHADDDESDISDNGR